MRMPFGKHRGEDIRKLPDDYIAWLYGKRGEWRPMLQAVVEAEFKRRYSPGEAGPSFVVPLKLRPTVDQILKKGRREMSKRSHPDVLKDGGVEMVKVNRAYEILVKAVEEATPKVVEEVDHHG